MTGQDYSRHSFEAMGTLCQVQFQAASHAASKTFKERTTAWVTDFENQFSRFIPGSLLSRINAAAGRDWVDLDSEAESLFALCDWFHWSTKGLFDPAMLPLLQLWDYHVPHSKRPEDHTVAEARNRSGWKKVQRRKGGILLPEEGMGIDLGGIGKEYAVDRVFELAGDCGIRNILVNFGQDLRVQGEPPEGGPWRVGLEDPCDTGLCWAGVAIHNRAVTTSGDYVRHTLINGEKFGHILDPRTGYPVNNNCQSVSVIAPTCTEAGILSTSAFILGGDDGISFLDGYYQAEGCIKEQNRQFCTRRFNEYLIRN
jgi:thiamine biosynthesis lipoprotein